MFEMVIYHDKTVKVTSKNCDKFIYYIDRVSMCLASSQVSCDEGIVPNFVLLANGLIRIKLY